jgi:hypothetical protein
VAPGDVNRVHAPALIGGRGIAGHPPTESTFCLNRREVHDGRDEALGIAAPSRTTGNRTTAIGADCAVITAHQEATASGNNVLKGVSTVSAKLQYTAIEAQVGVRVRGFKIEVLPEGQTWGHALKKSEL